MGQLAYFAIANAMLAALLGVLVWWIGRWIRRPAFVHVLWVLVLARLVAPPLLVVHVSGLNAWFSDTIPTRATEIVRTVVRDASSEHTRMLAMMRGVLEHQDLLPRKDLITERPSGAAEQQVSYVPVTSAVDFSAAAWQWIQGGCVYVSRHAGKLIEGAIPIWLAGTAVWCLIQIYLGLRFRARLRGEAYTSRIWQARTERIARRMGLRSCPTVLLVRAAISPMLWGFGSRTRLLFPERLLETLNASAQDTLLAHELAHYRRGDQGVRLLELLVTALFWWHPIVWWARYHLEAAEEECCDAWAVTQSNGCPRTYAEALLRTVDFVSVGRPILTPAASGVSSRLLRRRLTAIMRGGSCSPPSLTPDAWAGAWIVALLVLVPCPALWQAFGATAPALPDTVVALVLPSPQTFAEPKMEEAASVDSTKAASRLEGVRLFAKSANGQFLLALGADQRACLRQYPIGAGAGAGAGPLQELDLGVGRVASADFSPNNQLLAIGGLDGTVELIECISGQTKQRWNAGRAAVLSLAFSPDGQRLAMGNRAGECKVFRLSPFGLETIQRERGQRINCVRYSTDGSALAVVVSGHSDDAHIDVWDSVSGRRCGSLRPKATLAAVLPTKTVNEWLILTGDGSSMVWSTGGQLASVKWTVPEPLLAQVRFTPTRAETLERWLAAEQIGAAASAPQ